MLPGINTFLKLNFYVFTFVFVKLCDAYFTHAATEKRYRANHRETMPVICNAQYAIKMLVPIEKKM